MKRTLLRLLMSATALVASAVIWSAVLEASGGCACAGAGQVWIGSQQVGGGEDTDSTIASSAVHCAATICQGMVLALGSSLCNAHSADTFTTQWYWTYYGEGGGNGYLEQQYSCGDL